METLRAKQQMEILDVWSNLHKQIASRTRRQVDVFPDTLKPKTERDLSVEVNVDKAVESINKTIEQKLGSLEFYLQNARRFNDPKFAQSVIQAIEQATNTGDVIPLYNNIARMAHTPGISRETTQVIQVQLQALLPNLEAMTYGLLQAVSRMITAIEMGEEYGDQSGDNFPKTPTGAILDFLRTYAVYQFIKQEADKDNTGIPDLLTVEVLNSGFRNAFENLSASEIQMIKERIPNANWLLSSGMKNVPDFPVADYEARMKALEEELGFTIPDSLRGPLLKLPLNKQRDALSTLKNELSQGDRDRFTKQERDLILKGERIADDIQESLAQLHQLKQAEEQMKEEIDALTRGVQLDADDAEKYFQLLPELPTEPELPRFLDTPAKVEEFRRGGLVVTQPRYASQVKRYQENMRRWQPLKDEYDRIVAENNFIRVLLIPDLSQAQRTEAVRERQEMIQEGANSQRAITETIEQRVREAQDLPASSRDRELSEALRLILNRVLPAGQRIPDSDPADNRFYEFDEEREEEVDDEVEEYDGRGKKGNRLDTRGLGSLRKNYGFRDPEPDSSNSDSGDALDFDDRRNEHYYTRPAGRPHSYM